MAHFNVAAATCVFIYILHHFTYCWVADEFPLGDQQHPVDIKITEMIY